MSDKGPIEQIKELARQASLEVDLAVASHNAAVFRHKIVELEAKLEKLERWQAAAFIAHGNLDLDIEANPEALATLKGQKDE